MKTENDFQYSNRTRILNAELKPAQKRIFCLYGGRNKAQDMVVPTVGHSWALATL